LLLSPLPIGERGSYRRSQPDAGVLLVELGEASTLSSLRNEASFFGEDVRARGDSHVGSLLQDPQPDASTLSKSLSAP
jgi:hypothetical protein